MSGGPRWVLTAALAASIIAVCYGFARYAYGLFVPEFAVVFDLNATGLGLLGGLSTLGYTLGLLAAPKLAYLSARTATVAAGMCAAVGLIVMSASGAVVPFAIGLLIAGSSAGFISPAVAQLIDQTVRPHMRTQAQTWANTGTSFGLVASACAAMLAFSWRATWLGFGLLAATVTAIAILALPRPAPNDPVPSRVRWDQPGLMALLANSVLLGLTSAPYWNFSIERVGEAGLGTQLTAWFWLAIGIAGPAGGIAGRLCQRHGLARVNVATWFVWAIALGTLAFPVRSAILAIVSAAAFGAAYMALTGICILWAAQLFTEAPARGVTLSFLGLGIGQTVGSPLAGALADLTGLAVVFAGAAIVSLAAGSGVAGRDRRARAQSEEDGWTSRPTAKNNAAP